MSTQHLSATHKKAHKPHLAPQGLDARAVSAGKGFAIYMIDAGRNNSKFYEGLMLPNDDGTWRVMLRWGALTDSPSTRVDGAKFDARHSHLSEREAKGVLAKKYRAKTGKGYVDAWKHKLPKGQYPVGLKRDPGFGWGVQDAAFCVPSLRTIQQHLSSAQQSIARMNFEGASEHLDDAAHMAGRDLRSADSTMSKKIKDNIVHMQARASGLLQGDINPSTIKNWKTALSRLMSYIDKQLSVCHGKVASVSSAKKLIQKYLAKGKPFTFQDVYEDRSDPMDQDLYKAFSEMVRAKQISGPDPQKASGNHDDWKYSKAAAEKAKKPVYKDVEIGDGLDGSGNKIFVLQATKINVSGRKEQISIQFKSKAEAKNWVKHSMPGAKLAAAETDPNEIGKQKKPELGEGAEAMQTSDQRSLHEVADTAKSPTALWDGEGYQPKSASEAVDRVAARFVASRQSRGRVERMASLWANTSR